jgi:UDP-N-acetylglucosamine diphosphorylase / glucose-1-phosphate thymidylyltransferase / UDP-N-acetylgalactosamine diphosphorylase / glucosamine-1-phosphate N-acetyltransferase / galactosamine-1-phosphate N-acetyltransferase
MQAVLIEDAAIGRFGPLTLFRPEFDLRCGILTLREKLERRRPDWKIALHPRQALADLTEEACPGRGLESLDDGPTLVLHGRVIVNEPLLRAVDGLSGEAVLMSGGEIVGALMQTGGRERLASSDAASSGAGALGIDATEEVPARSLRFTWDLVAATADEIAADAAAAFALGRIDSRLDAHVRVDGEESVAVGEGCEVGPGVVLDARRGPVVIGRDVTVMPNAVIVGPASVGDGSLVRAGAVVYGGTSIGPVCKVGGEISGSVLQSHANKQHGGYLGNSFVGSWVNLGAGTNTSDLKNNYGNVRVHVDGEPVDTGLTSVGATIGDHSKTAIGTRLNTGSVVGVFCSVVTVGFAPKSVPSFSWITPEGTDRQELDRAIDTARRVMARRGETMTEALERRIREVYRATA